MAARLNDVLADELVCMAEEQFAAQAPLADLLEADETFARWAMAAQPTLLCARWDVGTPPQALVALWAMHDRHDLRLIEVVDQHGWPGRSLVGADGADAAWVIAQHADRHHVDRRAWLPLLEQAVRRGEADPRHLARLTDRVALIDKGTQRYGTWAAIHEGRIVFDPPAEGSLAEAERRRAEIGLPPLLADLNEPPDAAPYRYMRKTAAFRWRH